MWIPDECQTYVAQDFGGWTLTEGRNETMAMMAMMWSVISDLSAGDQDVPLTFEIGSLVKQHFLSP